MHYGILGTTTAHHDDGTPVPLGGARLRALLAALALRQGRPVPADLLVDEVWGDDPPQDSSAALQTLVGRLRRTIGREEIGSGPAGYWLTGRTDADDFLRLAADGRRALVAGDHQEAADRLHRALALWRGPALADLPDRAGPAVRLEARREEARRHRITADLALGNTADLTAELAELCELHPLDEQLHALAIRALRAEGRTAEALQRYEDTRRVLADRLGTDPGPELRALHADLLAPPPAAAPAPPAPAAVPAQPAPAAVPAVRTAPGGNLRPRLTSFVGRDGDLTALGRALTVGRLTTLTGPGGSGKTRLSVEAGRAAQHGDSWPDGVWMVELAPLEDPLAVPGAVAAALGLRETVLHTGGAVAEVMDARRSDPVRRLVEHCSPRRMLLVLDNCEHLVQAAADLADRLLAECPELTVLATSREPLGVPGEAVLPVEPLPDPAALRLLAERGAAARPGFDPAEDPEACAEICRRLDGLPLAIELAAARLRGLTPRQLADRLDGRFALLTAGSRTLLPRQQTLRAVVDWSWDLLGERERAVLRRLSVFAGGCTLEDAEQVVADGSQVRGEDVADLLLSLVDKSLVVADLENGPRYGMLETIHEYAAEKLAASGGDGAALRHVRHYRELVRIADFHMHGHEQVERLAQLDGEQENIRAALRTAVELRDEQESLVLVLGMSWFWSLRDNRREAREWYDAVCAFAPDAFAEDAPPPVPLETGPLDAPPPLPQEMLDEARRQVQLHRLIDQFTGNMAAIGDPAAIELATRVLATYTPDLPQSYRFPALLRVFAVFLSGELDRMRETMDTAVEGCRRYGRPLDLAFALQLRARLLNDWVGGLGQAVADSAEALEIFTRLGNRWGMSEALSAQAENAAKQGDGRRAAEAYRQSIEIATELGAWQEVPLLEVRLGEALIEFDAAEGERRIREALESVRAANHAADGTMLYGRLVLCNIHTQRGEYAPALAELDRLVMNNQAFGPIVPGVFDGIVGCIRGWVTARAGDPVRGLELLAGGRREMKRVPGGATAFAEHMAVMLMLPATGIVLALAEQQEDPRPAARRAAVLLGAHDALHGSRGSYMERRERDRMAQVLTGLLGEDSYAAGHAEGGRLTLSEAAALMDDPGAL
ncbi:AfsR/SARP family transcriptional regulator [Streptomyces sp. NRRL B-24484]|uniref:AfsR/SARP family transcriptional regulator n=1 Tax=Streptomyces sp. NRRL B-24484 TaxID=1463833 RepID=UPI0004BE6725|nr:BTAD domain-containing putative transcriptional regulator [Streptomyces sp. NRRL B-24484]